MDQTQCHINIVNKLIQTILFYSVQILMSAVWHTTHALRTNTVIMEKDFLRVNVRKGTCTISIALPAKVSNCYELIHLQVFSNRNFN